MIYTFTDGPTGKPVLEVNITGAVDQGQYVAFTCATNGNITSNPGINSVRLIKDEKPSVRQSHDFIFIIMVTDADSGVYYCILGNTIGFSKFSNFREIKVKIEKGWYSQMEECQELKNLAYKFNISIPC